ncbi:flavin-containing monooxygenase [Acuticoccus sediminis]|uniref:flavin-containing monooxygenase n=1 Tax=Acuticoccus sediminis TaxID=2184697 RepID=UPI001CFEC891|nr:NAD(P)-binding domain-containing protein [Acuticoccus sediminis]
MKVCVVGAGPSGLTTIKQLLDEGHEVVCHDKNSDVGGIWLRDGDDGTKTKAFDNLMLTISMRLMAYSDYPFPGGRKFYTRQQYFDYLAEYADRFGLLGSIRFDSEVTDVKTTAQGYLVTSRRKGVESSEGFDAVALCSGPFKTPHRELRELAGFSGEVVHSAEYRNAERFRGKRVLIVGLAESGADIVREIGDVASATTLAIRSYSFLLPRIIDDHRSTDSETVRAHHHEMYDRATDRPVPYQTFWGRSRLAKAVFGGVSVILGLVSSLGGDLQRLRERLTPARPLGPVNLLGEPMVPYKMDLGTEENAANWALISDWNRKSHPEGSWSKRRIFCKNVSFIPSIVSGKVVVNDAGLARAEGTTVHFQDGTSAEYDAVVLCTGYARDFTVGDLSVADGNIRNLYRHFLHPDHDGKVAFIGFVRPFSGGIPICAEMQARYFARVLSGKLRPPENLGEIIAEERAWEEYWTALSPRHTESHPSQVLYLDALAREIGCLLPMRKLLLNPKLFTHVWFGSFNPSSYRIVGPHSLGKAALADLYAEPVEGRTVMCRQMSLLRLLPAAMHPKHSE